MVAQTTFFSLIILVVFLAAAAWAFVYLPAKIAQRKGRSVWGWALLGFLFTFIALLMIAVLPSKEPTA
jgi:hypothetical protein